MSFLLVINGLRQAANAANRPIKIKRDNPFERLAFSEIKPITEGPARNPISPPVVTIAYPSTVLTPGMLADALNNTGTMQQQPNPTIIYPNMATAIKGAVTTTKNP